MARMMQIRRSASCKALWPLCIESDGKQTLNFVLENSTAKKKPIKDNQIRSNMIQWILEPKEKCLCTENQ